MSYEPPGPGRYWGQPLYGPGTAAEIDAGLRQYMVRVYSYMSAGLAISGLVAYISISTGFYQQIAGTPLIWIVMLAPLGMVLLLGFGINRMSIGAAFLAFWAFAALMGLSLAGIFLVFTGASIARGFFISAATFADSRSRQHLCRLECAAIRHLGDRRHRVHWAHRLRHAADQAGLSGERSGRDDDKEGDSRSFDALSRFHQFVRHASPADRPAARLMKGCSRRHCALNVTTGSEWSCARAVRGSRHR